MKQPVLREKVNLKTSLVTRVEGGVALGDKSPSAFPVVIQHMPANSVEYGHSKTGGVLQTVINVKLIFVYLCALKSKAFERVYDIIWNKLAFCETDSK